MSKSLDPKEWYPAREAAPHLGVTVETVKKYCRDGKVHGKGPKGQWTIAIHCKRVGPKGEWTMLGSDVVKVLKAWNKWKLSGRD